jgi:hypothetical protein
MLGTTAAELTVTDLVVHPKTKNAYISVMRGKGVGAQAALFRVDGNGTLKLVPLSDLRFTRVKLNDGPPEVTPLKLANGQEIPMSNYPDKADPKSAGIQTITDMAYTGGRIYVSGLANEEFASNMRSVPYPLGAPATRTAVEIYHGSHGQMETRSPIFTFVPYQIKGEAYIIASYLCTPLVKIPVAQLKPGTKVVGTTIAEFGNRNRPLDMIVYTKGSRQFLLMSNNARGVMKIPTDSFAAAAPINTRVQDKAGVPFETIASLKNVEQLDSLDDNRALIISRSDAGALNLQAVALP